MKRRDFIASTAVGVGMGGMAGCGGGTAATASEAGAPAPAPAPAPVPAPPPAPAAALPAWIDKLPLWQWYAIPGTALSSVEPAVRALGITGPSSKIIAWCGATLKRKGSIYMLGAAGGHADYAGNEVDALALNVEIPKWAQLAPPSPNDQVINGTQYYLDGRPSATHTYCATQYIDSQDRMVVMASVGVNGPFPAAPAGFQTTFDTRSFSFDTASSKWHGPDYIASFPGRGDVFSCLCTKHPVTEDVYYSRNFGDGWYRWRPTTNTWTHLSDASRSPWFAGTAVDPLRDRILVVGGYEPIAPEVRDLNGQRLSATFQGPSASLLGTLGGYSCVTYDESADRFLVVYNDVSSIKVVTVHPTTWRAEPAPVVGAAPAPRPNGVHNASQYVPELRGIVVANDYVGDVWFMRTSL